MAKVPGYANASVHPDKIVRYLLVRLPSGDKSKFMFGHRFSKANISEIETALLNHVTVHDVVSSRPIPDWNDRSGKTVAGHNYVVECVFQTPDGKNPCIKTVWSVLTGQKPTFQTLLP